MVTRRRTFKLTSQAKLRVSVHKKRWKTSLLRKSKTFTKSICCEDSNAMTRALKNFSCFCLHIEEGDVISTGVTGSFFIQKCNFAAGEALRPPCGTKDKEMGDTQSDQLSWIMLSKANNFEALIFQISTLYCKELL